MKILKIFLFILVGLFTWAIISLVTHSVADDIVEFTAINITKSNANISCCKFNWDFKLQVAIYSLYATVFIILTIFLIYMSKIYKESIIIQRCLISIFIMSFPSYTSWYINISDGIYYQTMKSQYNLVVPTIMSLNPISIIMSVLIAYKLSRYYVKKFA